MKDFAQSGTSLRAAYADQERVFAKAFALLQEGIEQRAFPGAAFAVTRGDELIALKGLGRFTYDASSPEVHAEAIWDLASLTKVVATTAMAMILYERGELDLNMPLAAIVPEFVRGNADPRRAAVTMRMLLAHSSGLPSYYCMYEYCHTREEVLAACYACELEADPGARAEYSDIGFILLGVALERIATENLDAFCRREVFGPLGMAETTLNPPAAWRDRVPPTEDDRRFRQRVIQGEVNDENAWAMGGIAGHAGVFSTAADVARFGHCMSRGESWILRPETIALFTRCEPSPAGTSRALGWDTPSQPSQSGAYFSARSFGHLGFTGTSLWCDPESGVSITLLTNRTWPDRESQKIKQVRPRFHDAVIEVLG
jgi:CubicO group peptidase (beta-lactamase class C family)